LSPTSFPQIATHVHEALEACPTCEQPIPKDRAEEINQRIAAHQAAQNEALTARLQQAFAREKSAAIDAVRREGTTALELERTQGAERIAAAREETRQQLEASMEERLKAANASAEQRVADLQRAHQEQNAASEARLTELQSQLLEVQEQHAADKERIQLEARQAAEGAVQEQLATLLQEKEASDSSLRGQIRNLEAEKTATEDQRMELEAKFAAAETAHVAVIQKIQEESTARETLAREQGAASATATMQEQLARSREEKTNALARVEVVQADRAAMAEQLQTANSQLQAQKESHNAEIVRVVQETRDALEKDKTDALNAEQAKRLQETQKLSATVDDLKRQLEKKSADELGEGAELDLFEVLKSRFEHDLIRRVPHGISGADIIHEIRENNVVCGKIVYDCKNRKDWKYEYATKLRTDKIAEKADHAVLSTNKFPAGSKQLHVHENVIIACPARVMVVAEILREQVVLLHTTRASLEAREEKSQELYTFMTSAQSAELFDTVDTQIGKLEKIDQDELRAHQAVWDRRGKLIKALEKAHGNLRYEVRRIVGALEADENE
jgi:hypothetical protein